MFVLWTAARELDHTRNGILVLQIATPKFHFGNGLVEFLSRGIQLPLYTGTASFRNVESIEGTILSLDPNIPDFDGVHYTDTVSFGYGDCVTCRCRLKA